jgi:ABC-2 type transport system permease protein
MNAVGMRTLLSKETRRFLKVPGQTIAQPVITTALYFLVFGFALGGRVHEIGGVAYVRFIVPGLVMLALIQNAFLNTASSMFIMKMQGTIVDILIAPLSATEMMSAFTLAAVVRGVLVGGIVWLVAAIFTGFAVASPAWVLAFAFLVAAEFALFGLIVAIWSDKFEQLNLVPTFVITPLTFLGGVFYSAKDLPEPWQTLARANPILYMVEGLRYGILGRSSVTPWIGLVITAGLTLLSGLVVWLMLDRGYKLRN